MIDAPLIFLGAGASASFGIPTMKEMVTRFEKQLSERGTAGQIDLWKDVKSRLETVYGVGNVDIEHMLTFFSFPSIDPSKLSPNVIYHYGIDTKELVEIVDTDDAKSIVEAIKTFIYETCDIENHKDIFPFYSSLWAMIAKTPLRRIVFSNIDELYLRPDLEIFTTNYDKCFEIFYTMANNRLKLHKEIMLDVGVRGGYYNFHYYQTHYPRLYKLHGSIRRYITRAGKVRLYDGLRKEGDSVDGDEVVKEWMIWPLTGKYIYQHPYSRLMDKFRRTLSERKTWLFVGFSFRDDGISLILKDVNDHLEDQERRGMKARQKDLILIDRTAGKKKELFKEYTMIRFWPITGEFGADETFGKLVETALAHDLFK